MVPLSALFFTHICTLTERKHIGWKIVKVLGWVILSLLFLLLLVLLFIRSPFGQDFIVKRLTGFVSDKTKTEVSIDRLFITFGGNLYLEGLYLEDLQGDTLVYSEKLETGMALIPFLRTGEIQVTGLDWEGLQARVERDSTGKFNFDFLLEAFSGQSKDAEAATDTSSAGASTFPEISLGPLRTRAWDIRYTDEVLGLTVDLNLGNLEILTESLDLNRMDFHVGSIRWENTDLNYHQNKPFPASSEEESGETPLPVLVLDELSLANINLHYQSVPDGMDVLARLGAFDLELPEADLENQKLQIKSLMLRDTYLDYQSKTLAEPASQTAADTDPEPLSWPEWQVTIGALDLADNEIRYQVDQKKAPIGVFDPDDLGIRDINLKLNQAFLNSSGAGASLKQLSFRERSGFTVEDFQVDLSMEEEMTTARKLELKTGNSQLSGNASLNYSELLNLLSNPDQSRFDLRVEQLSIGLQDAFYFSPELEQNDYFKTLARKSLKAGFSAKGDKEQINLEEFSAAWGNQTTIELLGSIQQPLNMDRLSWQLEALNFVTVNSDMNRFLSEESLGISFPDTLELGIKSKGNLNSFSLQSGLEAFGSKFEMDGRISTKGETYAYDLQASLREAPLGQILNLPDFGSVGFDMQAKGNTGPAEDLNLRLDTEWTKLEWKGHDYEGMNLLVRMENGKGDLELQHQDEFLDVKLKAETEFNQDDAQVDLHLDLQGADFNRLNISPNNLRGSMQLNANYKGNSSSYDLTSRIREGTVVLEEQAYPLGDWDMSLRVMPDTTDFTLESNILQGELHANADPAASVAGIIRHFNKHFKDTEQPGHVASDSIQMVAVDLELNVLPGLLLDRVLLPDLERMDEGSIALNFDESREHLEGTVDFPYLSYAGIVVDSLGVRVNSDREDFDFAFGLLGMETGPLALGPTYFTGEILEELLYLDFNALDGEEVLAHMAFDLGFEGDSLKLHVNPDSLILNKKTWSVPDNNELWLADSSLVFKDFTFSRENQTLSFYNKPEGNTIGLNFDNFRLATFTSLLNPDEMVATGRVDGEFVVENPFGATGLLADISITDLGVLQVPLGNLSLNAATMADENNYDFNLSLGDGGIELNLNGDYLADSAGAILNLKLDLEKLELAVLAGLSQGAISGGEGYLSGEFNVKGNTNSPEYQGRLRFNETTFTVSTLNAAFALDEEEINLDNQGVYLDQLTIEDNERNGFTLDGQILTESLSNPAFDLELTTRNFRLLNSTVEDNDLFYGDAIIGADVSIRGDLTLPEVNANLTVEKGTNLSFVVPESQLDVVEREGVVTYVNRNDPDDILTKRLEETSNTGFSGYQVSALLKVSPEAIFNVVIDARSGDNLMVEGAADLRLDLDPNGRVNLTGIYELSRGHYELSLYNMVNRRFEIREGSSITWGGDPLDASMEITAIYKVETSAVDLMTATAAGGSRENMMQYRQQLPFQVFLNIEGEMLRPLISFRLDMPEDEKGAIGGSVYSQVQQLNSQEGELNRQVFSLLVLNRFFPSGGNAGGGGTTAMAKSSVSQLLSSELNSLTNNMLGGTGFELDVDLDSFQDYQGSSPQSRTQLNLNARKRFLDDRLIVQVGSQIDIEGSSQERGADNALLGNVSIEYLLTENGRYRIRGFRKNQFESFIDGQLVVTGFSAIFNREFNRFEELWKGIETRRNESDPLNKPTETSDENQDK